MNSRYDGDNSRDNDLKILNVYSQPFYSDLLMGCNAIYKSIYIYVYTTNNHVIMGICGYVIGYQLDMKCVCVYIYT